MKWFANLKVSVKLLGGFLLVAVFAGIIGAIGIIKIRQIDAAATKMYEKMAVPLSEIGDLETAFQRMRCNLVEMAVAVNDEELKNIQKRADERDKEIDELLDKIKKTILTEDGRSQFKELVESLNSFDKAEEVYEKLIQEGKKAEALAFWKSDFDKVRKSTQSAIEGEIGRAHV